MITETTRRVHCLMVQREDRRRAHMGSTRKGKTSIWMMLGKGDLPIVGRVETTERSRIAIGPRGRDGEGCVDASEGALLVAPTRLMVNAWCSFEARRRTIYFPVGCSPLFFLEIDRTMLVSDLRRGGARVGLVGELGEATGELAAEPAPTKASCTEGSMCRGVTVVEGWGRVDWLGLARRVSMRWSRLFCMPCKCF